MTNTPGRVLIIGDVMLDEYVSGTISRMSPEAPVPVFLEQDREYRIGGAGNVAAGVSALGVGTVLIGVAGEDTDGAQLSYLCTGVSGFSRLILDKTRITTKKTRFTVDGRQILRVDNEICSDIRGYSAESALCGVSFALSMSGHNRCEVVVLSDYAKGVLTSDLCRQVVNEADLRRARVIVDPKIADWRRYSDTWLITPNLSEMRAALALRGLSSNAARMYASLLTLMQERHIANCLVTESENGMTLVNNDEIKHFEAHSRNVADVTGAGDTVVAVIAALTAAGTDLKGAIVLANAAAGLAVQKRGTYVVTKTDLLWLRNELGVDVPIRTA